MYLSAAIGAPLVIQNSIHSFPILSKHSWSALCQTLNGFICVHRRLENLLDHFCSPAVKTALPSVYEWNPVSRVRERTRTSGTSENRENQNMVTPYESICLSALRSCPRSAQRVLCAWLDICNSATHWRFRARTIWKVNLLCTGGLTADPTGREMMPEMHKWSWLVVLLSRNICVSDCDPTLWRMLAAIIFTVTNDQFDIWPQNEHRTD